MERHDNGDENNNKNNGGLSASSLEDSRASSEGSTSSSSDMVDDASSPNSFTFSFAHSSGPLFELSELMAQLPIKRGLSLSKHLSLYICRRGLSKYFEGKSQSFTSLSRVMNIEDLAKKETPYRRKMKPCKSYGGGLDNHKPYTTLPKATISKKASRSRFFVSSK
ncbi:hypothetical protein F2P56_028027 [Juglans regia]|uniref:Uncharacterized protein n=1 Tax=Juglans regia TaxID=51240 RepID=A0A833UJL7_JUGRE|nr:hypothetical protein F2P56_028027 [Juglans regia]